MRIDLTGRLFILAALTALVCAAALAHPPHEGPCPGCAQFELPPDTPDWIRAELDCLEHVCGKGKALALRHLQGQQIEERDPVGFALMRDAFADTDVLHYDLEIEIFPENADDPNAVHIAGTNAMTIESKADGLSEFVFRLREQYAITSASVNGTPISVSTESITTRRASLDRAYDAGEVFTLEVSYEGPHVNLGLGSIVFWEVGNPPTPAVYTLSQPYYAYTWWPCKDGDVSQPGDNIDKATLDFAIIAPEYMRSVANGVLVSDEPVFPERHRYAWSHGYPVATYLVAFSSAVYNTWTVDYVHDQGVMPVEFNIYPVSDSPSNRAKWELVLPMLDVFSDAYGPYPFLSEKYGIYQFGFGGGMEHQTNSGQGTFIDWISAHELGHQWWGDAVTCRTWHDIWLNEGLAVYSEALWAERRPGSDGLEDLKAWMDFREPGGSWNQSVYVYDTSSINRIFNSNLTYDKAGWVFHMLRGVVGDDVFFDILAEFRATFEGSAASTEDFRDVAEAASGKDLSWFFEQWVYGPGAPVYLAGWSATEVRGEHYLRLRLRQPESYVDAWGLFRMPLEIEIATTAGPERVRVWHDVQDEYFTIPVGAEPLGVTVDPDDWVLDYQGPATTAPGDPPPALVSTTPAPEAVIATADAPSAASLVFVEAVNITAGDVIVLKTGGAAVSFSLQPAANGANLLFDEPLGPGRYTVTISESVTNTAGIALDGEILNDTLPSGEGLPGGDAVFSFSVGCRSDLNGDGFVDGGDLNLLLAGWDSSDDLTDLNNDGIVNGGDLNLLLAEWDADC